MTGDTLFHWLVVLVIALVLFAGRKIPPIFRNVGGGPQGGPHPLPITSPVETSGTLSPERRCKIKGCVGLNSGKAMNCF